MKLIRYLIPVVHAVPLLACLASTAIWAGDHYLTLDSADWREAQATLTSQVLSANRIAERAGVSLVKVNDDQLNALTDFFHEQKRRCGGFFAHVDLASANRALQSEGLQSAIIAASYTIDQQAVVRPLLGSVSESQLRSSITTLSSYQNRYYNSSHGKSSSEWLHEHWRQLAASRSDITVVLKSCSNCGIQQNVVLTIPGTDLGAEHVVLGAHADSIIGGMTVDARAPGADDDASGVAVLTEILRVALASNFRPRRTVQFMAYAAEEVGLRGSQALANEYQSSGKNVHGVIQFDMTNYAGTGADVWVMTDNGNATTIQFLRDLFDEYLAPTGLTRADTRCGYGCSDHASWSRAGFPAAMYAETSFNQTNPNLHTVNDTLAATGGTANHSVAFAKLGIAFAYEAGKTGTVTPPPPTDTELFPGSVVSNLSGAAGSDKFYFIRVPGNAASLVVNISGGSGDADLYTRFGSRPTTSVYDCRPYRSGNSETCTISNPQAGEHYINVRGYAAYSGVTLTTSLAVAGGTSFENTSDYAIPDNNTTGVQSPVTVTGIGNAGTVSVQVAIVHPYIGDLIVDLVHPDGAVYNLHNRSGGNADNINQTYSVNVGTKLRAGTWNLRVRDRASADTGFIDRWQLTFP